MNKTARSVNGNTRDKPHGSGSFVKDRLLASLAAAHIDPDAASASTGCRLTVLDGPVPLLFVEVVTLAQLLDRSPATFFPPDGYTASFTAETTNPQHPCCE
ncbi:adenine glycosylase [Leifsonia xyli subsp. cynodontis DSM 46306]|uniref:Uncharacterized protein n=1 Tax=Leifsonia xyli subsp. cynodontis DSM 46306 TaxID=1389489 RepID=U3PAK2_LEIXC|nr:hypothetical protein [Leifsonia xyli]AGW40503.1 adenine glycosylase [Leifsonia xyli subsp. cynodontis DSM 46306]